jgi:hypothetical protein
MPKVSDVFYVCLLGFPLVQIYFYCATIIPSRKQSVGGITGVSRMKQQIVSRWDSSKVLFECEVPDDVPSSLAMRHALQKAVAKAAA